VLVLRRFSDDASSALQCENCHGCFVRVHDWTLIVDDSTGGHPIDTKDFVVPEAGRLPVATLIAMVRCPACHKEMDRFHFGVQSSAVVDVCEVHGMWLDAGELAEVLAVAGEVAKSQHLPAESDNDKRDDAILEVRLKQEELEVGRNVEIARANFRTDPLYRLTERWEATLGSFGELVTKP
jgi:Zn-finger nucleic acid-binding protein